MIKRAIILEAAARLFGDHGYRGATTRRIAQAAGVSEVTLFRQFGTKDALLREALGSPTRRLQVAPLPETPANVERELVGWCADYLRQLRAARKVIRKSLGEADDRPRMARRAAAFPTAATRVLREYLGRASRQRMLPAQFDVTAAATVLAGVLFADALGRDLMPDEFPKPASDAHRLYVRFVLARTPAATHAALPGLRSAAKRGIDRREPGAAKPTVFDRRRTTAGTPDALAARASSRRGRGGG